MQQTKKQQAGPGWRRQTKEINHALPYASKALKPIQRETFRGLEATGYSPEPLTWPRSRRSQQQFTRRRAKQQSQSLLQQIQQENEALQNKDRQIRQLVWTKVKEAYGFLPSSKSIF
jgi:hypothetical protein